MGIKIGINGLGRIGRMIIRSIVETKNKNIEIVYFQKGGLGEGGSVSAEYTHRSRPQKRI